MCQALLVWLLVVLLLVVLLLVLVLVVVAGHLSALSGLVVVQLAGHLSALSGLVVAGHLHLELEILGKPPGGCCFNVCAAETYTHG